MGFADGDNWKRTVKRRIAEVDDLMDEYKQQWLAILSDVIMASEAEKKTAADDLVKIYHDYSVRIETSIKKAIVNDAGVPRQPGEAEARLQGILALMKEKLDRDASLRKQLPEGLDDVYTTV